MFKIGMEVIIEREGNEPLEKLRSKVADITGKTLLLSHPIGMETNKTIFLRANESVFISFADSDSGAYLFKAKIAGHVKNNQVPLLVIPYPKQEELMKVQRRKFVRVEASLDIVLRFPEEGVHYPTVTQDFSAGGCLAIIPQDLHLNSGKLGKINIVLPMQSGEFHYLLLNCRIVRVFDKHRKQVVSLQFLSASEYEQQLLIRYAFEKQLEYRKRGAFTE